ncbi:MAG: hypothetical protein MUQ10_04380 [Anaerolineae bacterium]|nr:hypothetical protein [Anaerolineae bacterium]
MTTVILTEVYSDGEFESSLENLFYDAVPGDRFILWFGENVPTDAKFERIQRIAGFWKENSAYPLSS